MVQTRNIVMESVNSDRTGVSYDSSERLMTLLDIVEGFNGVTNQEEVFTKIGNASQSLMNAQVSLIMLLDRDNDEFCIKFCTGLVKDEVEGKCIPKNQGFRGWVAEHKLPIIKNDIKDNASENDIFGDRLSNYFAVRNLICAPLLDKKNNLLGVIEAINCYDSRKLTEDDIPVFQALANQAAITIERVKFFHEQNKRLKAQKMHLTEIHHRVKNDLALISGIVEIERLDVESEYARNVLKNIQTRIKSMAVIYELLSGESSHTHAEVGSYFKKLVKSVSEGLRERDKNIAIQIHTDSIVIDHYKALSCGLILNELLLNSYKYAFEHRSEGTIEIALVKQENSILIDYKDDGPGLPDDFKIEDQDSIGFKMILAFVSQLDGELEIQQGKGEGAHFMIRFEAPEKIDS